MPDNATLSVFINTRQVVRLERDLMIKSAALVHPAFEDSAPNPFCLATSGRCRG
jgi:hypothetical protein